MIWWIPNTETKSCLGFLVCKVAITLALLTLQIVLDGKVLRPQKILFNVTYVDVYTSSEMRGLGMTGTVREDPARRRGPFKDTEPYTELDTIVKQEGKCTC